jgi:hypothetical protein
MAIRRFLLNSITKKFGRVLRFVFGLFSRSPKFHYPLSETVIFILKGKATDCFKRMSLEQLISGKQTPSSLFPHRPYEYSTTNTEICLCSSVFHMIDHAVKKILSYELNYFICKNIHRVLGTEIKSAAWQNRIHEAVITNRTIKRNVNFNGENFKWLTFTKVKKIMPGTPHSMVTENPLLWYQSPPIVGI